MKFLDFECFSQRKKEVEIVVKNENEIVKRSSEERGNRFWQIAGAFCGKYFFSFELFLENASQLNSTK